MEIKYFNVNLYLWSENWVTIANIGEDLEYVHVPLFVYN
jgi:hypothetical protein